MPPHQRVALWLAACVQLTAALIATQELWPPLAQQDPAAFGGPEVPPTQTLEPESLELSRMLRDPAPSPLSPMMRDPNPSREEWEAPEPFSTWRDPVLPQHREPELPELSPTLHGAALSPQPEFEPPGPSLTLRDLALAPQQGPEPPEPSPTLGGRSAPSPQKELEPPEPFPTWRGPALAPQRELEAPEPSPTLRGRSALAPQQELEPPEPFPTLNDLALAPQQELEPPEPSPALRRPALAPQQELEAPEPSPTLRGPALAPQQGPEPITPPETPDDPLEGVLTDYGKKHTLDKVKYPNAKCLDGTQGAYYFSPGILTGMRKFYLFRMGGGWCKDLEDCKLRRLSWLGNTDDFWWPNKMNLGGKKKGFPNSGFNRNSTLNPLLWNWNHVYMIYCDGAYFAGTNSTPTFVDGTRIHFRGADIQNAILDDLNAKYGLQYASDIVLGGCSAGGIATYTTSNSVFKHPAVAYIPRKAGFAFSGFFMDLSKGIDAHWYFSEKKFPWYVQNISGSVDQRCMGDHPEFRMGCFIPEIAQAYLKVPLFIWESMYDTYQLENVYGDNCTEDPVCISNHKRRVVRALNATWTTQERFGGFLGGCGHHCEDSAIGDVNNIRPIDSTLPLQALAKWYNAYVAGFGLGESRRLWFDSDVGEYPCKDCCPKKGQNPFRHMLHDLE